MPTLKERFNKQFKRWTYMIEAYGWKLTVYYCGSSEDMPDDHQGCNACSIHKFRYLEASIYVNLRKCKDLDDEEIEYVVIHELTHLLVAPLQESSEETPLEYTVSSLARIMHGLRKE
jgi:hypothetical protein